MIQWSRVVLRVSRISGRYDNDFKQNIVWDRQIDSTTNNSLYYTNSASGNNWNKFHTDPCCVDCRVSELTLLLLYARQFKLGIGYFEQIAIWKEYFEKNSDTLVWLTIIPVLRIFLSILDRSIHRLWDLNKHTATAGSLFNPMNPMRAIGCFSSPELQNTKFDWFWWF